jgi:hypothetical protein
MSTAATIGGRAYVYAFVVLLLAGGWWSIEAFPLTGWHFFSGAKSGDYHEWAIVAVTDGEEAPLPLGDFGQGYEHTTALLDDFGSRSVEDREAACDAWAAPLRQGGVEVDELRIYEVDLETTPDGPREVGRSLGYTCGR